MVLLHYPRGTERRLRGKESPPPFSVEHEHAADRMPADETFPFPKLTIFSTKFAIETLDAILLNLLKQTPFLLL